MYSSAKLSRIDGCWIDCVGWLGCLGGFTLLDGRERFDFESCSILDCGVSCFRGGTFTTGVHIGVDCDDVLGTGFCGVCEEG